MNFPIKIIFEDNGETRIINCLEDIPFGRAFTCFDSKDKWGRLSVPSYDGIETIDD